MRPLAFVSLIGVLLAACQQPAQRAPILLDPVADADRMPPAVVKQLGDACVAKSPANPINVRYCGCVSEKMGAYISYRELMQAGATSVRTANPADKADAMMAGNPRLAPIFAHCMDEAAR